MSEIIGRMRSKTVYQVWQSTALEFIAKRLQILLEQRALTVNLLVARIKHRQPGCADRKACFGVLGSERACLAVTLLRLMIAVHRHQTVAPIHQRIDTIG